MKDKGREAATTSLLVLVCLRLLTIRLKDVTFSVTRCDESLSAGTLPDEFLEFQTPILVTLTALTALTALTLAGPLAGLRPPPEITALRSTSRQGHLFKPHDLALRFTL